MDNSWALGCPQEGHEQSGPRGPRPLCGEGPSLSLGERGLGRREGTCEFQAASSTAASRRKGPVFQHAQEKIYIEADVFSNGFLLCSPLFSL